MDERSRDDPRAPRRSERVYLALAIATYCIAVVCLLLSLGLHWRDLPEPNRPLIAAGLFVLAGSGLLLISTGRARR